VTIRTFISYAHDSGEHCEAVVDLAGRLRADGIDARIDRYVCGSPDQGWPAWMEDEMEAADFVIVVCSPTYYTRYRGKGDPTQGRGARWEGDIVRNLLYDFRSNVARCLPVLLPGASEDDIPDPLRHTATRYRIPKHYMKLRGDLVGTPETEMPPLSPVAVGLGASEREREMRFSKSISRMHAEVGRAVEHLTAEQFKLLEVFKAHPRVLIKGCAGSGKTLMAVEKAMRLARGGNKTLFLCHNPLLAAWVEDLVQGTGVKVSAFEDLVANLVGRSKPHMDGWTSYSSPTSEDLDLAIAAIDEDCLFDAVIVDEGQDFPPEWWVLVEDLLRDGGDGGTFYVFADDQQALLPFRNTYPIDGPPMHLSRNCRNSGAVFDVMRRLTKDAPRPEQALLPFGRAIVIPGGHTEPELQRSVSDALQWLQEHHGTEKCRVILGGGVAFTESVLYGRDYGVGPGGNWRSAVESYLESLVRDPDGSIQLLSPPDTTSSTILESCRTLSGNIAPTPDDVANVRKMALCFGPTRPDMVSSDPKQVVWTRSPDGLKMAIDGTHDSQAEVWDALKTGAWARALPGGKAIRFAQHYNVHGPNQLPVYTVGEMKGLEADSVLLVMQGSAPEGLSELFVGASRARTILACALDHHALRQLPPGFRARYEV
jgi:SEFIR domain